MKIAVLGSTGMLGQKVSSELRKNPAFEVIDFSRSGQYGSVKFDARRDNFRDFLKIDKFEYAINCIGVVKSQIVLESLSSTQQAVEVNSLFPHKLVADAKFFGVKLIQIGTDCVFSGSIGGYDEESEHDAHDVYGKTKSLGEISSKVNMNLRASIIGRELNRSRSLLEWFLGQSPGARINGFQNHFWNGISTLAFAKIVSGVIRDSLHQPGTFHIVPEDFVSKFELLGYFRSAFQRNDIKVCPTNEAIEIDRTLSTIYPEMNLALWRQAGYSCIPTIYQLVSEMASDV